MTIIDQSAARTELLGLIDMIPARDAAAMHAAQVRQNQLTKPTGALGRLEGLAVQLAGMTGNPRPRLLRKAILIAAGDHGVCAEGVSAYPQSVTGQMLANFLHGGAAINVLARQVDARITVVDAGVVNPLAYAGAIPRGDGATAGPRWVVHALGAGTANFTIGPAMTTAQAVEALIWGAAVATEEIEAGLDVLGLGEMGIGNTTAAAAVACALTGMEPAHMVGPGTGIDAAGLRRKAEVVARGLAINDLPDPQTGALSLAEIAASTPQSRLDAGLKVLAGVGGFELGLLAGAVLAAAGARVPVIVDGFVATAAAMLAVRLAPAACDFLIAAHRSAEPGHAAMLAWLGLEPWLALDMRLGEGTGAALCMPLVDAAWRTLDEMATFDQAGVSTRAVETEESPAPA